MGHDLLGLSRSTSTCVASESSWVCNPPPGAAAAAAAAPAAHAAAVAADAAVAAIPL